MTIKVLIRATTKDDIEFCNSYKTIPLIVPGEKCEYKRFCIEFDSFDEFVKFNLTYEKNVGGYFLMGSTKLVYEDHELNGKGVQGFVKAHKFGIQLTNEHIE